MKKSEMVNLLDKLINSKCDYGTVFEESDIIEILDFLVEKGMLPPTTKLSVINATDNGWDEED